jgi:AcrR family transcriptional regulator
MARNKEQVNTTLLLALACGASNEAAARQANVSTQTVWRRLQEKDFQARLKEMRSEMVTRTSSMLTAASLDSVKTLLELQKSGPPTVKLGAARAVIELACKLREIVDLQGQIADLEAEIANITQEQDQFALRGHAT